MWGDNSWFLFFCISLKLIMLNIFACTYWPCLCLSWINIYLTTLLINQVVWLLLFLSYKSFLYILNINPYWNMIFKYLLPFSKRYFVDGFSCCTEAFEFHVIHVSICTFVPLAWGNIYRKILLRPMSNSILPKFSLWSFMVSGLTFESLIYFGLIFVCNMG